MRIFIFTLLILFLIPLSAQILPIKYFEEAYFTNYHHQELRGKLQNSFSTPILVLKHLIRAKTIEDFSKIQEKQVQNFTDFEKEQNSNLYLFSKDGVYGQNYSCLLEYMVEFEYQKKSMAIIAYQLFLEDQKVIDSPKLGRLYLYEKMNRWYLFGETLYENENGTSDFSRIGRAFSNLKADNWEYLISKKLKTSDPTIKEMRYFIVDQRGINLSKFNDLTLYWGIKNRENIEQFYSWPPCRNFQGWDTNKPGVEQWFDTRNSWILQYY